MHSSPHWKDTLTSRQRTTQTHDTGYTRPTHRTTLRKTLHTRSHTNANHEITHHSFITHARRILHALFTASVITTPACCYAALCCFSRPRRAGLSLDNRPRTLLCCCCCCSRPHCDSHNTHCMRAAAGASPLLLPPSPLLPSNPPLSFLSDDEPEPLSFTQSLSPAHLSCHHIIQLRRRPSNHEPRTLIGRSSSPASPLAPSPPTAHHSPQSVAQTQARTC